MTRPAGAHPGLSLPPPHDEGAELKNNAGNRRPRPNRETETKEKNMKNDKIINGETVRKNPEHKGMWDIIEERGGRLTGKVTFTGTMKEVRQAIKLGIKLGK